VLVGCVGWDVGALGVWLGEGRSRVFLITAGFRPFCGWLDLDVCGIRP